MWDHTITSAATPHWHSIAISPPRWLSQTLYWHADWPLCTAYLLKADWLVAYSSKSSIYWTKPVYTCQIKLKQMNISVKYKMKICEIQNCPNTEINWKWNKQPKMPEILTNQVGGRAECRCNRMRMTLMKLAIYKGGWYGYYSHVQKPHVYRTCA